MGRCNWSFGQRCYSREISYWTLLNYQGSKFWSPPSKLSQSHLGGQLSRQIDRGNARCLMSSFQSPLETSKKDYLMTSFWCFSKLCYLETGSLYIAQAGLELSIVPRPLPSCLDHRHAPLTPTWSFEIDTQRAVHISYSRGRGVTETPPDYRILKWPLANTRDDLGRKNSSVLIIPEQSTTNLGSPHCSIFFCQFKPNVKKKNSPEAKFS